MYHSSDYMENHRLDPEMLDDEDRYSDISDSERRAAETEMNRRDRTAGIHRDERDLAYDKSDDESDIPRSKRRAAEKAIEGVEEDTEMIESIENLEDTKGHTIKEWVSLLDPRTEISNRLRTYVDEKGQHTYRNHASGESRTNSRRSHSPQQRLHFVVGSVRSVQAWR
jgi:DNA replication licensing factor MCM2